MWPTAGRGKNSTLAKQYSTVRVRAPKSMNRLKLKMAKREKKKIIYTASLKKAHVWKVYCHHYRTLYDELDTDETINDENEEGCSVALRNFQS